MSDFQGTNMPDCTVQLWYNKQRVSSKKNGSVSLYIQIIVGSEHDQVKISGLRWPAEKIDWKRKQILPRFKDDPDYLTYMAIIERERAKYWSVVTQFLLLGYSFNLADIFRKVNLYRSGVMFCAFMQQAIRERQKTKVKKDMIKETTAEVHKVSLRWFRDFLGNNDRDIDIAQIDGDLLERFADYMRTDMLENSVWVKIQNIKSYLSYAFRHKIVVNPDYKNCVITLEETEPVWLEEDEVELLLDLYWDAALTAPDRRNLRAFLFACFTGLRISDLSRWSKEWIKGDFIHFLPMKRRKSQRSVKPLVIPILPIAREFIEELTADTFELPDDQVYNRGLKSLAAMAGIDKNITSHVARHTYGTSLAVEGVVPLAISKLMGHKSLVTTNIYIHLANNYLAREAMKLQARYSSRRGRVKE